MHKAVYILTVMALWWPATAAAQRAHKAQTPTQLIQRELGPGTNVGPCWRIQSGIRCDYSTPGRNVGVVEEQPGEWTWTSWADVVRSRVFLTI